MIVTSTPISLPSNFNVLGPTKIMTKGDGVVYLAPPPLCPEFILFFLKDKHTELPPLTTVPVGQFILHLKQSSFLRRYCSS